MITPKHMKLKSLDNSFDHCIFADWYRFGCCNDEEVPLIIYVGGAISMEEYRNRERTEPLQIAQKFNEAFCCSGLSSVDLLVLPFPPDPDPGVNRQLFSVLVTELLRQTLNPRPQKIGCIGNSIGASFASYLTFNLVQVKVLATLGGYGMVEGANESNMAGETRERAYRCWWNADSPGYMENLFFLHFLTRHDVEMEIMTGDGGHDFTDYVANGSVREAFEFILSNVLA